MSHIAEKLTSNFLLLPVRNLSHNHILIMQRETIHLTLDSLLETVGEMVTTMLIMGVSLIKIQLLLLLNILLLTLQNVFQSHLNCQGRNKYINRASQIAYYGTNNAFVFYENQIRTRKLMDKIPCDERRLEILRA